jgi:NADH:ubiquinone oxidoreductase subunit 3 (subunit A)
MNPLILIFIIVPILSAILLFLNLLFAPHNPDSEKVSTFECGFIPLFAQTRTPFFISFYLIGILFTIFDLEIFFILPLSVSMYNISTYGFTVFLIFFIILTLGFVYELGAKVLDFTSQRSYNEIK